jgi:hypothetical protein
MTSDTSADEELERRFTRDQVVGQPLAAQGTDEDRGLLERHRPHAGPVVREPVGDLATPPTTKSNPSPVSR